MQTAPKARFEPTRIASDTYLNHGHQGEDTGPESVARNSVEVP